jgi:hypothetical protein
MIVPGHDDVAVNVRRNIGTAVLTGLVVTVHVAKALKVRRGFQTLGSAQVSSSWFGAGLQPSS